MLILRLHPHSLSVIPAGIRQIPEQWLRSVASACCWREAQNWQKKHGNILWIVPSMDITTLAISMVVGMF